MPTPRFGAVQLRIMRLLWQHQRLTARDITDALSDKSPIAHSTVQTLLRKLEAKGAVGHEQDGRTFIFFPLVKHEPVRRSAVRELIDRVFDGSPVGLVACLLRQERLSKAELGEIRELIEREGKGGAA